MSEQRQWEVSYGPCYRCSAPSNVPCEPDCGRKTGRTRKPVPAALVNPTTTTRAWRQDRERRSGDIAAIMDQVNVDWTERAKERRAAALASLQSTPDFKTRNVETASERWTGRRR